MYVLTGSGTSGNVQISIRCLVMEERDGRIVLHNFKVSTLHPYTDLLHNCKMNESSETDDAETYNCL